MPSTIYVLRLPSEERETAIDSFFNRLAQLVERRLDARAHFEIMDRHGVYDPNSSVYTRGLKRSAAFQAYTDQRCADIPVRRKAGPRALHRR
jgi:hypothetical protein